MSYFTRKIHKIIPVIHIKKGDKLFPIVPVSKSSHNCTECSYFDNELHLLSDRKTIMWYDQEINFRCKKFNGIVQNNYLWICPVFEYQGDPGLVELEPYHKKYLRFFVRVNQFPNTVVSPLERLIYDFVIKTCDFDSKGVPFTFIVRRLLRDANIPSSEISRVLTGMINEGLLVKKEYWTIPGVTYVKVNDGVISIADLKATVKTSLKVEHD